MAFSSAQRTSRHGQTHTHKQTRERIELIMQLTFVNSEYFIRHESLWISKIGGEGTRKRGSEPKIEREREIGSEKVAGMNIPSNGSIRWTNLIMRWKERESD